MSAGACSVPAPAFMASRSGSMPARHHHSTTLRCRAYTLSHACHNEASGRPQACPSTACSGSKRSASSGGARAEDTSRQHTCDGVVDGPQHALLGGGEGARPLVGLDGAHIQHAVGRGLPPQAPNTAQATGAHEPQKTQPSAWTVHPQAAGGCHPVRHCRTCHWGEAQAKCTIPICGRECARGMVGAGIT
jgi:hypothetical protein